MRRQATNWDKVFTNHIPIKEKYPESREHTNLNNEKTDSTMERKKGHKL